MSYTMEKLNSIHYESIKEFRMWMSLGGGEFGGWNLIRVKI